MNANIKNHCYVGIDLGSANTKIAILDETGRPDPIPNPQGDKIISSTVYAGSKEFLFGKEAESMTVIEPEICFRDYKRDVGKGVVYPLPGGGSITPEELQTMFLKYVKECVVEYTGDPQACGSAVITVPAHFDQRQRQAVEFAAGQAGIEVIKLLNEPTAAALCCEKQFADRDCLVMIADAGGCSIDLSVVSIREGHFDVRSTYGLDLGGQDVDEAIVQFASGIIDSEHGISLSMEEYPVELYELKTQAIKAKHHLAVGETTHLRARIAGKPIQVELSRGTLHRLLASFKENVRSAMLEAMSRVNLDTGQIDYVVPVGGSSRLGVLKELNEELFGRQKVLRSSVECDLSVAFGAAKEAARVVSGRGVTLVGKNHRKIPVPSYKLADVMPFDVGIAACDNETSEAFCSAILARNLPMPCSAAKPFGSLSADQEEFDIRVLQGGEGEREGDCVLVGQALLRFPPRDPDLESLEVGMAYDESGIICVSVTDRISRKVEDITIDYFKGGKAK